jgi:hypothetical protein
MRRLLRRKAATIIAAIISLTAIPSAGIVATAVPALASVHICNVNGVQGCVGAPTVNNGDPVKLTVGGRDINLLDQHFKRGGDEVYRLQFAAAPSQCVGVASSFFLTLRDCSGGNNNNTNWIRVRVSGGIGWESNTLNNPGLNFFMDSTNTLGEQLRAGGFLNGTNCPSVCYSTWNN